MGRGKGWATPSVAVTFRLDTPPFGSHHFAQLPGLFLAHSCLAHSATLHCSFDYYKYPNVDF
jgi:hypothetical protein